MFALAGGGLGCKKPETIGTPAPPAAPTSPAEPSAPAPLEPPDPAVAVQAPYTVARTRACAALVTDGTDVYWVDADAVKAIAVDTSRGTAPRIVSTKIVDALAAGSGVVFAVTSESVNVPHVPGATSSEPSIPLDWPVRSTITQLVPAGRSDPVYGTMVGYRVTDLAVTAGALVWHESGYSDIIGFVLGQERRMPLSIAVHLAGRGRGSVDAATLADEAARAVTVTTIVGAPADGRADGGVAGDASDHCEGCVTSDERHRYWLEPSDHTLRVRRRSDVGPGVALADHLNDASHVLATEHTLYWLEAVKGSKASWAIRAIAKP
jgi:hypothetical protein